MMNIIMLDAETLGDDMDFSLFKAFGDVTIYRVTTEAELEKNIQDAEVLIANKIKLNASNLPAAKKLRLICVTATGYDNIDIDYCREHNIAVCNVTAYSTNSVAQVTMAMALSLASHLEEYTMYVKNGSYTASEVHNHLKPAYHEVAGMTWGVIGMGNIGRQVARTAQTMGCHVLGYRRKPDAEFTYTDLETICRRADIISLHVPLNSETEKLINADALQKMKPGVILVNMARGAVMDEEAVTEAYEQGIIGGLGIDVYTEEPLRKGHCYERIMHNPNVILTPHMAWGAYEARTRCMQEIAKNIEAFLHGEKRNRIV